MTKLTNDQMVEINGGINWDALDSEECISCYKALGRACYETYKAKKWGWWGVAIAAIWNGWQAIQACKPCYNAVFGDE